MNEIDSDCQCDMNLKFEVKSTMDNFKCHLYFEFKLFCLTAQIKAKLVLSDAAQSLN